MPHPAMIELCHAAGYDGEPPETLSTDAILAVLNWCDADLDPEGNLWMSCAGQRKFVELAHGHALRELLGPDG